MSLNMSGSGSQVRSEDEIPQAIDKCIADGIIKTGSGAGLGTALSLVLFRRRMWPVMLGVGVGLGMALANCQINLNSTDVAKRNASKK